MWFGYLAVVWAVDIKWLNILDDYEISFTHFMTVYAVGFISIFLNVIPKYIKFDGAQRHLNDQKNLDGTQKKFFARNYIRLLAHIISGGGGFIFCGWTLWCNFYGYQRLTFQTVKMTAIAFDFVHEVTIVLLTRNHDGIFNAGRVNNWGLAVIKAIFCKDLYYCNTLEEGLPYITALYIMTSGFSPTRVVAFFTAVVQLGFGIPFEVMAENWYSVGLLAAHAHIGFSTGNFAFANMLFLPATLFFRHELWKRDPKWKNEHPYELRAQLLGLVVFAIYVARRLLPDNELLWNNNFHAAIQMAMNAFCFCCLGQYFKRKPLIYIDYQVAKEDAMVQEGSMRELAVGPERDSIYSNYMSSRREQSIALGNSSASEKKHGNMTDEEFVEFVDKMTQLKKEQLERVLLALAKESETVRKLETSMRRIQEENFADALGIAGQSAEFTSDYSIQTSDSEEFHQKFFKKHDLKEAIDGSKVDDLPPMETK